VEDAETFGIAGWVHLRSGNRSSGLAGTDLHKTQGSTPSRLSLISRSTLIRNPGGCHEAAHFPSRGSVSRRRRRPLALRRSGRGEFCGSISWDQMGGSLHPPHEREGDGMASGRFLTVIIPWQLSGQAAAAVPADPDPGTTPASVRLDGKRTLDAMPYDAGDGAGRVVRVADSTQGGPRCGDQGSF
jgi:hypothetical protein